MPTYEPDKGKHRIFFILNPVSGILSADQVWRRFHTRCEHAGHACTLYRTTGKENLKEVVLSAVAEGYDLFVAGGGDGTVSAVADGLYGTGLPMAILPVGTWNALARGLDIPLILDGAIRLITGEHDLVPVDGMLIDGRIYLLNAGVGISSSTMMNTERRQKRHMGWLAYPWNFFLQLFGLQLHSFLITADDRIIRTRASEIMIMNSNLTAIKEISNMLDIKVNDSKLELCIIRERSIPGLLLVAANIIIGRPYHNQRFEIIPISDHAVVQCNRPMITQADGDIIGRTPLSIKLLPAAAQIVVPIPREGMRLPPMLEEIYQRVIPHTTNPPS